MRSHLFLLIAVLIAPARVHAVDGLLDPQFGTGGRVTFGFVSTENPTLSYAKATAIADAGLGRLVVAGNAGQNWNNATARIAVARLLSNGSLDATFGSPETPGRLVVPSLPGMFYTEVSDLAVDSSGGLILVGTSIGRGFALRLDASGQIDTTFGTNGVALTDAVWVGGWARHVAICNDGSMLIGGWRTHRTVNGPVSYSYPNMFVWRIDSLGATVSTYGTNGVYEPPLLSHLDYKYLIGMAMDGDCGALISGARHVGPDFLDFDLHAVVARITPSGTPDPAFGVDGLAEFDFGNPGNGYAIFNDVVQPNPGELLLAGITNVAPDRFDSFVMALDDAGGVRTSFGSAGMAPVELTDDETLRGGLSRLFVQSDGRVLGAGSLYRTNDDRHLNFLSAARLSGAGVQESPDDGFGGTGWVSFDFGDGEFPDRNSHGATLNYGDRLIFAGGLEVDRTNSIMEFAVARLGRDSIFGDSLEPE